MIINILIYNADFHAMFSREWKYGHITMSQIEQNFWCVNGNLLFWIFLQV